ncbi:Fic family protein [Rubneribacter badeniensis]|uniref:Fic family protein n=1 Tax=Rubneribacter badeniensis TaxID=2070688 RepID=UPI003A93949B
MDVAALDDEIERIVACEQELRAAVNAIVADLEGWGRMVCGNLLAETSGREFKQAVERSKPKSWLKTVSAFANTYGGQIVFGVTDDIHEPVGIADPQAEVEFIARMIHGRIDPVPRYSIEVDAGHGVQLVVLEVQSDQNTPHYYVADGRREVFVRNGDRSETASRERLMELVLMGVNDTWDARDSGIPVERGSFTHLCSTFYQRTFRDMDDADPASFGLVTRDGSRLTNAGALFADKGLMRHSRVFATRWEGNSKGGIVETEEYSADLLGLLEFAERFIRTYNHKRWIKRPTDRIEFCCYSERAITEALVNALVHRSYLELGSEVHIDVYDDRLEIISPGEMCKGSLPEDVAVTRMESVRRNPIVADVMGRMDLMERRGSGLMMICEATAAERSYKPEFKPQFKSERGFFSVILPNMRYGEDEATDPVTDPVTRQAAQQVTLPVETENSQVEGLTPQVAQQVTQQVTQQVNSLLSVLLQGEGSLREIMGRLGLRDRNTVMWNYLNPAIESGFIERTIPDKPNSRLQKYRLTELGRRMIGLGNEA